MAREGKETPVTTRTTTAQGPTSSDGATEPPRPRRKRGPNKPKPAPDITVTTDVTVSQEQIQRILFKYVTDTLGADVASSMVLQARGESDCEWRGLAGLAIRYATVRKDNG